MGHCPDPLQETPQVSWSLW